MLDSRSEFLTVRGLRHHVRQWGTPGAPKLFLLHGWMDVSASFQFVAQTLARRWHLLAPDWRGFGLTDWPVAEGRSESYWFPDYLADLEALLDVYAEPGEAINLIGHSMGGNVACLYAGVRPARVRRLVNLEGFGLPPAPATAAIRQLGRWLDDLQAPPTLRAYASLDDVAARLRRTNPRLTPERAAARRKRQTIPTSRYYPRNVSSADPLEAVYDRHVTLYRPKGCDKCAQTGFTGRRGIYELLMMDDVVGPMVLKGADAQAIKRAAMEQGMDSLRDDGARKVLAGLTSLEEVLGATQDDVEQEAAPTSARNVRV